MQVSLTHFPFINTFITTSAGWRGLWYSWCLLLRTIIMTILHFSFILFSVLFPY